MLEHLSQTPGCLDNLLAVALNLSPWLLVGAAAAGLIHGLLPAGFVRRSLRGRWGVVKAVLLGIPLPLCSCGVIPAAVGLKKDGASDGASVGFLISTPQTGVDSILVSASFLGWPFALFKVFSAFVMGMAGGLLADLVSPGARPSPESAVHLVPTHPAHRPGLRGMFAHAVETLESIWYWLLFGVVLSAAISTFIPPETMQRFASLGPLGTALVMLVLSLPMYVCSTSSVPIAAALVAGGMPHGAALVFLVAGPASNVATIGAVYKTFGARVFWVYLSVVALGSLGLGMLFDGMGLAGSATAGHQHEAGPLAIASTVVVAAAMLWFAVRWLGGLRGARKKPATEGAADIRSFQVQGMSCQNCARKVETRAGGLSGVKWAKVRLDQQRLEVAGPATDQEITKALEAAGYRAQRID